MTTEHAADSADHSPRMVARRQAMIDAAAAIFFEHGFERASLSAIVRRSGGSLSTLYQLFGSKEGLFEAMMTQRCGEIMEPLSAPDLSALCPRETLTRIARALLDLLMDPEAQGLWRMVMGEGIKFPGLAEIYFRCGPDILLAALRNYLAGLHERGAVYCPDAMAGAQSFCMMVHGEQFFRIATGLCPPLDDGERERHVRTMVEMFMRMVGPER
ncbi:TetR/AcrR family transcriptional regulator C-terminal domain-containing protein [Niveispirillum sp. KHB5.9]|uniref:TetR/AcrR family transcriptional regulator C-terminal domain-containing protein n=1 Tax=Niveispirillum sp. KHB5.9 TaxID=3400269 RepID=UPI003A8B422A